MRVAKWKDLSRRETHHRQAKHLRHRACDSKPGIRKALDVPSRVEVRVISAVAAFEIEFHLQRRQPEKILKRDEVGAAAKRGKLHFSLSRSTPGVIHRTLTCVCR